MGGAVKHERISPELVVNAMQTLGLKVTRGRYYDDIVNPSCACGLGAVALSGGVSGSDLAFMLAHSIGGGYAGGFVDGFDGQESLQNKADMYTEGYLDGRAAYKACRDAGIEDETDTRFTAVADLASDDGDQ